MFELFASRRIEVLIKDKLLTYADNCDINDICHLYRTVDEHEMAIGIARIRIAVDPNLCLPEGRQMRHAL